jgi:hypothetical protein
MLTWNNMLVLKIHTTTTHFKIQSQFSHHRYIHSLVWCAGKIKEHLSIFSMDVVKGDLFRLTASPPEIDCDKPAMGLPVTSVAFLIAKLFW